MQPLYRLILKKAWSFSWHHKILWIFGFLTAFLGNGGEYEVLIQALRKLSMQGIVSQTLSFSKLVDLVYQNQLLSYVFLNVKELLSFKNLPALFVALTLLAISLLLVVLIIISQVSLIYNAAEINRGKKPTLKETLGRSIQYFWPTLGINIITYSLIFLLTYPFLVLTLISKKPHLILSLLSLVILVPLAIMILFIAKYTIAYLVLEKESLASSLKRGVRLFSKNWLISFEMALILLVINLLVGLGVILSILVAIGPLLLIGLVSGNIWVSLILLLFLFLLLLIFSGAILSTLQFNSWTLLFIELNQGPRFSKIIRLATTLSKRLKDQKSS